MSKLKTNKLSWRDKNYKSIEAFVYGLGKNILQDPINQGYCALWACIINGSLDAGDVLHKMGCL